MAWQVGRGARTRMRALAAPLAVLFALVCALTLGAANGAGASTQTAADVSAQFVGDLSDGPGKAPAGDSCGVAVHHCPAAAVPATPVDSPAPALPAGPWFHPSAGAGFSPPAPPSRPTPGPLALGVSLT